VKIKAIIIAYRAVIKMQQSKNVRGQQCSFGITVTHASMQSPTGLKSSVCLITIIHLLQCFVYIQVTGTTSHALTGLRGASFTWKSLANIPQL
jgi:hypothetical protein